MTYTTSPVLETPGVNTPTACRIAGVSYRQADYWARTGLVVPSIRAATGPGSHRRYAPGDVVDLLVVARLLAAGFSLQFIRRTLHRVRAGGRSGVELDVVSGVSVWVDVPALAREVADALA